MNGSFKDLGISQPILQAIEEMEFKTPTDVQKIAIPHILNKEDLIIMSKTGSGKTAVFGVSILQLTDPKAIGPQCLVLTPTRELAVQVDSDLKQMSKYVEHRTTAVYGQHSMNVEIQALKKGATIVTGTPGRVFDHISQGNLNTKNIRFLVLDEADRMLDMGFFDQVLKIIKTLPRDRVTLLFSATIPSEIKKICREYMKTPLTIEIESQTKTVDTIRQVHYRVDRKEKQLQLNHLLLIEQPESCIIFCNTKYDVDHVHSFLSRKGYSSEALHGDIPQGKRLKTMDQFKQGHFHLLVATDVAARGIHVDDLSLVINYDVPLDKDSYVHRIGRTGRAGNGGHAITLVTTDDIMSLYDIEEHIGAVIDEADLPTEADYNLVKEDAEKWILAQEARAAGKRLAKQTSKPGNAPQNIPCAQEERASGNRHSQQSSKSGNVHQNPQEKHHLERSSSVSKPKPHVANTHNGATHGFDAHAPKVERSIQTSPPKISFAPHHDKSNAQPSTGASEVTMPTSTVSETTQIPNEKKSFLQKILSRFSGK